MSDKYVDYFRKEVECCRDGNFTGHLVFQVNFRDGRIGNMNIGVNQSVKLGGEYESKEG